MTTGWARETSTPGVTAAGGGLSRGHTAFSCVVGLNNPPRFFNPNHTGVNMFNFSKKAKLAALAAISAVTTAPAFAAVDAAVTTAISDGKSDAATIGGAVLAVIVAIAVFKYMRRAV